MGDMAISYSYFTQYAVHLLKENFDGKNRCLLLISSTHYLNLHLEDAFSFLISCLVQGLFLF